MRMRVIFAKPDLKPRYGKLSKPQPTTADPVGYCFKSSIQGFFCRTPRNTAGWHTGNRFNQMVLAGDGESLRHASGACKAQRWATFNRRRNTLVAPVTNAWFRGGGSTEGSHWRPAFVEARFWLGEFNKPLISMLESGHIGPKIEASMNRQFALVSTVIHAPFAESLMTMMA